MSDLEPPLWACLYVSSAAPGLTLAEIDRVLQAARLRNARERVSGLLLYGGGNFMQYFEGPQKPVDDLRERLAHDPRHHDMRILLHDPLDKPRYADWRMGFLSNEPLSSRAPFATLAEDVSLRERLLACDSPVEIVMRNFHENMR